VDVERGVLAFEVTGPIPADPVSEREVLCASGCANRVGLNEGERVERSLECRRREETACDSEASQLVEGHGPT
jgi:hypothetical protein